ncbi:MAG: aconitase/3-isopropylmalate dehydratase large subunit family protein [Pseudomonadota bacterium]
MGQTIAEKILSRAVGRAVSVGETIYPEPDLITCHDWYVVNFDRALKDLGVKQIRSPEKVLISTDHEPVALSLRASERQKAVREIVGRLGIEHFYDAGRGGHGHVFPIELGYVRPGMLVLAYDTHVTNYGAVGCLGIAMVTEITEVLACGSAWIRVPPTVRVNLHGRLRPGTSMRDVAQRLTLDLPADLVDYSVVEYAGPALKNIGIGGRMTLCNTPLEIGAKSAIAEPDVEILGMLAARARGPLALVASDPDAVFKAVIDFDMSSLEPQVAAPPRPDNVMGVSEVAGTAIQHAFIGSCANCSLEDLRDAARVLRGRKLSPAVRMIVTPGTQEIATQAHAEGLMQVFSEAGAMMTQPGCGPCAGGVIGTLGPGETSINTGTRNDPGRLGPNDGRIYLASPMTVAASAIAGEITDPRAFL